MPPALPGIYSSAEFCDENLRQFSRQKWVQPCAKIAYLKKRPVSVFLKQGMQRGVEANSLGFSPGDSFISHVLNLVLVICPS